MNTIVLIVDDDPDFRFALKNFFKMEGYKTLEAPDGKTALSLLEKEHPSVILLDQILSDMRGTNVLEKLNARELDVPVIMMTGYGDIKTAVESMKLGAANYITKPFSNDEIRLTVLKTLKSQKLLKETEALRRQVFQSYQPVKIVSESRPMKEAISQIERIAGTDLTVILQGESGTGKEVFARKIHEMSVRNDRPFFALDCGTIPETLVESELFGYEKGAFTGADQRKLGTFELAESGTIFLDEIGNIPLQMQSKLLRVIQERKVQHLGGKREIPIDVRIIVATNLPLEDAIKRGIFRKDLFYRINQFTLWVPPLRNRKEDILPLAHIFLGEANVDFKKNIKAISPSVVSKLINYHWPGNIRQLANVVKRAVLLAEDEIMLEHIPFDITSNRRKDSSSGPFHRDGLDPSLTGPELNVQTLKNLSIRPLIKKATGQIEKKLILEALRRSDNNRTKAAQLLGIDRTALHYKLHQHKIK